MRENAAVCMLRDKTLGICGKEPYKRALFHHRRALILDKRALFLDKRALILDKRALFLDKRALRCEWRQQCTC